MRALANEIAKNLMLAGIGSLTIQDSQSVVDGDLGAQFLVSEQDVGKNVRPSRFVLLFLTFHTHSFTAGGGSFASTTETQP